MSTSPHCRPRGSTACSRPRASSASAARSRVVTSCSTGGTLWKVNSTAQGGGVAEMLRSLVGYVRGAGLDVRWVVIARRARLLPRHQAPAQPAARRGRRRPLGDGEREVYERVTARRAPSCSRSGRTRRRRAAARPADRRHDPARCSSSVCR